MFKQFLSISPIIKTSLIAVISVFALLGLCIAMDKPKGSISGQIQSQKSESSQFKTFYQKIKTKTVYALATTQGKEGESPISRGAWINESGKFQINNLPIGEYSLQIKAPNYQTIYEYGINVEEAKDTNIKQKSLEILEASVNVGANKRVFTTKEKPYFWVNASGADKAEIKIYKANMKPLILAYKEGQKQNIEFSDNLSLLKPKKNITELLALGEPIQTLVRELKSNGEDWTQANIKLDKPLSAGDYIVSTTIKGLNDKQDYDAFWFSVSDLGLIIKQAPDQALIRAVNLITLQPEPDININLFQFLNNENIKLTALKTGSDGFATYKFKTLKDNLNLWADAEQANTENRAYYGLNFWPDAVESYKTYFYTEKPVYRLGQTVFYKGIIRQNQKTPKNLVLKLTLEDPDGEVLIPEFNLKTNAFGSFNGLFEIPADGKTGAYTVKITYPDGTLDYAYFEIAEYKKPEFKVEIIPLKKRVKAGEKLKARIKANYYFGGAVQNAKIQYSIYSSNDWTARSKIMPRPAYYEYFDDWENENYEDEYYSGDHTDEGKASLDENGEAIIEIQTKAIKDQNNSPYGDISEQKYKIQADITDISGSTVTGSGSALITKGDFALFIDTNKYFYTAGDKIKATISAINYDKKPVSEQRIKLSLIQWKWQEKKNKYSRKIISELSSQITDSDGKSDFEFELPKNLNSDSYYLRAESEDGQIISENSFWIDNNKKPFKANNEETDKQGFDLKADKPVYKVGETAKILINSPLNGSEKAQAIISMEADKIYEYKVININSTAQTVEIPIKKEYTPNIYFAVALIDSKHILHQNTINLKVSPEEHFLNINIKTAKQKYKPAEEVEYIIEAKFPDGKPAANTEVSLGIVDESIYAIREETAENMQKFFYKQRSNSILTLCSFPEEYSGGPDKIEPLMRKDFKDTAGWFPNLITDGTGIAKIKVKLPDNLTSWRATARAINQDLDLGFSTQNIISTQDIVLRLALPRFYTEGDKTQLSAIVHNYSEDNQKINLEFGLSEQLKTDNKNLEHQLNIAPDKMAKFSLPIDLIKPGTAIIQAKALTDQAGIGDAIEMKVPILPLAVEDFINFSGILKENKQEKEINWFNNLPSGANIQNINLSVTASGLGSTIKALNNLIDYPYGCTEQTMSRLIPSTMAVKMQKDLGITLSDEQHNKFTEVYKQSIHKLKENQTADGAWGWWAGDKSNLYLTNYVLEGLYLLTESGFTNPDIIDMQEKGLKALIKMNLELERELNAKNTKFENQYAKDSLINDFAYMQYIFRLYKRPASPSVKDFFIQNINKVSLQALAYMNLVWPEKLFIDKIWQLKQDSGDNLIFWKAENTYSWTDTELTALIYQALLLNTENYQPDFDKIKNYLLLQKGKAGWENTKTTVQVLKALLTEEIQNRNKASTDNQTILPNFSLNIITENIVQNTELPLQFDLNNLYEPEKNLEIIKNKNNKNTNIKLEKNGNGNLYYQLLVSFLRPINYLPKSLPDGIKLERKLFKLETQKDNKTDEFKIEKKPLFMSKAKSGEILIMQISFSCAGKSKGLNLPYILIEAPIPSGAEILNNKDARQTSLDEQNNNTKTNYINWCTHQDILDDKISFFATSLVCDEKPKVFEFMFRPEISGKFNIKPAHLEGMYTKQIKAFSKADILEIN
jgi:alpha-2-macroglobulin